MVQKRRAKTETVFQLEAAECGAASLSMILGYHGRRLPLQELRTACGVSRDGSKASNLLKAARRYGMIAKGLKAEPEDLRDLRPPMIAFVNFNHFLVVEGFKGDHVYLNDPAVGHRRVSFSEFDAMFTGVVLTFQPDEGFETGDDRPSLSRSLLGRTRGFRLGVAYVFAAGLALVIPGILLPVYSRVFVDNVLVQAMDDWLWPLVVGMLITAAVRYALMLLQTHHLARAELQLAIRGSLQMFRHILHLPIGFFGVRFPGEIAGRLLLNDHLASLLTGELARAVLNLLMAVFFLAVIAMFSGPIALVVAALTLLNLVVLAAVSKQIGERYKRVAVERGKLIGVGVSGLQDIETLKAAGYEDSFFSRWAGLHANVVSTEQQIGRTAAIAGAVPTMTATLANAAILTLGGLEVMQGRLSLGSLVALQSLATSFAGPVTSLTHMVIGIQDLRSHVERIDDIFHHHIEGSKQGDEQSLERDRLPTGEVQLRDISFGYSPLEPPLIEDFSLEIPAGKQVALVGSSGSGKSTLGRIIAGLNHPIAGQLLFDGVESSRWPRAVLAAARAHVDQEIVLFEGTVRENLSLWDGSVSDAAMVKAAQDAKIHDVVAARPGGYGGRVDEGGRNFSGGQRQRLEIARALTVEPRILVLDEATSALDPATEARVMANLRRRGCTLVIIAHRLSTIRDCDEIIVLSHGKPVERGTHDVLMAMDGAYRRLIEE